MAQNDKTINLDAIMTFARQQAWPILLRAAISFGVVLMLFAIYAAFAPRSESYRLELQVTVPERNGVMTYENGTPFSTSDLVAAPLLQELWQQYGYAERGVKFIDFTSAFAAYNWNKERAAIDAEFAGKLAKRNITVAEISAAQRAYEERVAALDKRSFVIAFSDKGIGADREATVRMLAELPGRWSARAHRVYAPTFPVLADAESIKGGIARFAKLPMAEFDVIDYLTQYCEQLSQTCGYTRSLMKGTNLEFNGMDVGKLTARIDLAKREIERLFAAMLAVPGLNKSATRFIQSRREAFTRDMAAIETQIAALKSAIAALSPAPASGAAAKKDGGLTVQADGNFLDQYAELVKQSAHAGEIAEYVDKLIQLQNQCSSLKRQDLVYAQIERTIANPPAAAGTFSQAQFTATLDAIVALGVDVEKFRNYVMDNYLQASDFYRVQTPVYYAKSYKVSLPRVLVGLLALWALYNLAYLVLAWNKSSKS